MYIPLLETLQALLNNTSSQREVGLCTVHVVWFLTIHECNMSCQTHVYAYFRMYV